MNNEDSPDLSRNQDSKSSPDRNTTASSSSSESTWITTQGITTQGILESFSSPATPGRSNSESYSQLDNLRRGNRKLPRTRPLTPIPTGETTTGNSETSKSVNTFTSPNVEQDNLREQAEDQASALSGYSPGKLSSPSITTTAKMASFDTDLEHLVLDIMRYDLKHPLATALEQAYITTFDEFRSIEVADVGNYTICDTTTKVESKLHSNLVKAIQRGVSYARHLEDSNDPVCDDPTRWDSKTYFK
jgi:hypothetical protein